MDEGLTFAEHVNQGVAQAGTEFVVLLNQDTIPRAGWLEALLEPFTDPRVGITGAALFYPDGGVQHAGVYLDYPGQVLTAHNVLTDEPSRSVEATTGACMAVRGETWMQLGGLDEQFRNGYEDVDFCLRAREQGWRVWYAAESHVVHLESQSGQARWAHVGDNIRLLHERWAGKLP